MINYRNWLPTDLSPAHLAWRKRRICNASGEHRTIKEHRHDVIRGPASLMRWSSIWLREWTKQRAGRISEASLPIRRAFCTFCKTWLVNLVAETGRAK